MLSPLPRHSDWGHCLAYYPSPISLPRMGGRFDLCNVLFEDCSAFTRVTACTLAGSSKMICEISGLSRFVTSVTAPIASGWSNIAGWVSHPLENAAFAWRTPNPDLRQVRLKPISVLKHFPSHVFRAHACLMMGLLYVDFNQYSQHPRLSRLNKKKA